jgi:hypothetical protein
MTLSKAHFDRLREVLTSLIKREFDSSDSFGLKFQDSSALQECRDIWKDWRDLDLDIKSVKEDRNQHIRKKVQLKDLCFGVIVQLMMAPYEVGDIISPDNLFYQEIEHWFLEGSTDDELHAVNPTLIRPFVHKWKVHYAACAFEGYLPLQR